MSDQPTVCGHPAETVVEIEIRGVHDGVLFRHCLECDRDWHTWPEGSRLAQLAEQYIEPGE